MRIDVTVVAAGLLGAATTAVVLVGAAGSVTQTPRIALADNTVSVDPPAGDGSLADGQILTPFDVQNPRRRPLGPATSGRDPAGRHRGVGQRHHDDRHIRMALAGVPAALARQRGGPIRQPGGRPPVRADARGASKHVIGEAVDIGGVGADQWLMDNGARYGLCRIYANEVWHFELATDAAGNCPPLLPNAAG